MDLRNQIDKYLNTISLKYFNSKERGEISVNKNLLEHRYFEKLKILIYADSRGTDVTKGSDYEFYTQKLKNKYNVDLVVKPRKWTTIFDFIEYYDKSHKNYDLVVAHVGISDWSPRPLSQVKKIYSLKRTSILNLIPKQIYKNHIQDTMECVYEGEITNNLYSLDMANKYIIPRLRGIPNLIFISSNHHVLENRGNYWKERPSNIDLVEKYSSLFCKNLPVVIDLSSWSSKEVSVNTHDGMHPNERGSNIIYNKLEHLIQNYIESSHNVLVDGLIGKSISDIKGNNFEIKREKVKDKPLFILGSGPSLGMIDVKKLKNCYTMAFNRSYIAFDDWGFDPTYFVGLDFVVNQDNKKEYRKLILNSKIKRFFFSRHKNYERYLKNRKVSFVDIIDMPTDPNMDFDSRLQVGNSGLFGLQIAIGLLGFREIYLIGCDANYKETVPGIRSKKGLYVPNKDNDPNHFRKDYYGKGTVYNKPGNYTWHYPAWKAYYENYIGNKYLGAKVYNCSPISKLKFFKYIDFNKAIKDISKIEAR